VATVATSPPLPAPPLRVVLIEPQIPPNTGNVARLCAATGCHLVLVGELGFQLGDAQLKRAGLDYWRYLSWERQPEREAFFEGLAPGRFHLLSARAGRLYTEIPLTPGDALVFGKETTGLPRALLERYPGQCYTIPIKEQGVRSLNLSSAVAIVVYDALRRLGAF
jgi:tRNA (cytidine/uridine-2'-O-)-methyltransferase